MLSTVNELRRRRFEIVVAAPPEGPLAAVLHAENIPHAPWSLHDSSGLRLTQNEIHARLANLVASTEPDILHANSLSTARIAGPPASAMSVPCVGHLRDIIKLSRQAVTDINKLARIVAVSSATLNFHVNQGLDARKGVVIYNGVDLTRFFPRPRSGFLHAELGIPPDQRLLVTIGQLGPRKATDIAMAAAREVISRLPDVHWLFVGTRTSNKDEARAFEQRLFEMARMPIPAGRVHFLGAREDVDRLLPECTLLVHAARQEPLGRVLLEAAASGLAVVATGVGGTREIFPSPDDGAILVPPDDPMRLAFAVIALLENQPLRESLGLGGRRRAERAFDARRAADDLAKLYLDLLP